MKEIPRKSTPLPLYPPGTLDEVT